jgi:hypothetical protein
MEKFCNSNINVILNIFEIKLIFHDFHNSYRRVTKERNSYALGNRNYLKSKLV